VGWGSLPPFIVLRETALEQTMRRISDVDKKKSAKNVRPKGARTLFLVNVALGDAAMRRAMKLAAELAKSTAILPEESLTSEVQALLYEAAGSIECATGAHGRCVDSKCRCRCHKSRARSRSKRRMRSRLRR
jgi:hypothetical protein